MPWSKFIKAHLGSIVGMDFFTVEVMTLFGIERFHVLFVIDIGSRVVEIAGIGRDPDGQWMLQMARNLLDAEDGFLRGKRYLIMDRDPLYTAAFRRTMKGAGVKVVRLPARSPNLNAFAERFVLSIKTECLERMVLLGERHLRRAISEYMRGHGHRRIELVFLSVGEPCRTAAARPRPVCVARLTGFLGPDGAFSSTRGSLRHPALVDVPSVQPVSALATRLRGWRSCGPEFRRTGRQSHGFENLLDGVLGLDHGDEAERGFAARADGVDLERLF